MKKKNRKICERKKKVLTCQEAYWNNFENVEKKVITTFWMDAERAFQQVIDAFADIDIQSRVAELEFNLFFSIALYQVHLIYIYIKKKRKNGGIHKD